MDSVKPEGERWERLTSDPQAQEHDFGVEYPGCTKVSTTMPSKDEPRDLSPSKEESDDAGSQSVAEVVHAA